MRCLVWFFLLACGVVAAQTAPVSLTRMTLGEIGGWMLLEVSIEGVRSRLILDTGASRNLVSPALARRLSLKEGANVTAEAGGGRVVGHLVKLPTLQVGELQRSDQEALVIELHQLIGLAAQQVDGILGVPFLEGLDVDIDLRRWRIHFHADDADVCPAGLDAMPFDRTKGLPVVPVVINGRRRVQAVLDTGNPAGLVWLESKPASTTAPGLRVAGARLVVADEIAIGALRRQQAPLVFYESPGLRQSLGESIDALAGTALLDGTRFRLSLLRQRLCLESVMLDVAGGFGLLVARREGELYVDSVLPGGPAQLAGLRPGELISYWMDGPPPPTETLAWAKVQGQDDLALMVGSDARPIRLKRTWFAPRFTP